MSLDLLSGLLAPYQGGGAPMETTSPLLSLALQAVMQPQPQMPPMRSGGGGGGGGGAPAPMSGDWLSAVPKQYRDELAAAAQKAAPGQAGFMERLFGAGIVPHESSWIPTAVNSSSGAAGLTQLMPFNVPNKAQEFDPFHNLLWGMDLFKNYLGRESGNVRLALADYAAGPGNQSAGLHYADAIRDMLGGTYR